MQTETIREAVAVFDDPEALEEAVSELQSRGIDRADLSILAPSSNDDTQPDAVRAGGHARPPRDSVVTGTDLRQERVLGTSLAATITAFLAAGITVATGGVAAAVVGAVVGAAGSVGIAGTLVGRKLAQEHTSFLDAQLAAGGVLLWVHIRDDEAEQRVIEVLRRHSAKVSVHDHPAASPAHRPIAEAPGRIASQLVRRQ